MLLQTALCLSLGILIFHLSSCTSSRSETVFCSEGQYYNLKDEKCKKCSTCPDNQLIKTLCTKFKDLECGPFSLKEFPESDADIQISYSNSLHDFFDEKDDLLPEDRPSSRRKIHIDEGEGPTTMEKEDREYWRTLAFALIGLLSVLIIVATVVVLLACRKLQRVTVIKQPEEGEMDDADSGYVVIRAIRNITDRANHPDLSYYTREDFEVHPPLLASSYSDTDPPSLHDPTSYPHPGRLCFLPRVYTPQRRLLNYDSDDVFEVEDSFTSGKATAKNKLHTIAEKSVSNSSKNSKDNSGMV